MADFTAGSVLTAAQLDTAFNTYTIRDVSTTTATLGAADAGGMVNVNNNSGGTVTVPLNSTWAAETGTHVIVFNGGTAGTWTIAATGGVTIPDTALTLAAGKAASVFKTATNTWRVLPFSSGGSTPAPSPTVTEGSSTNGTFSTLTNPDGDGKNYRKAIWTSSGQFVTTTDGWVEVLVAGAGGPYTNPYATGGTGGWVERGWRYLLAGTHAVTVGAATTGSSYTRSGFSALGSIKAMGGVNAAALNDGAGDGSYGEITSTIEGSSNKYAGGPNANTNNTTSYGSGGVYGSATNPENGVVIVRYVA